MNWNKLESVNALDVIKQESENQGVLIFKHSTRCSISAMALSRLERSWKDSEMQHLKAYYLDLLKHREISNQIALDFGVMHESPQIIIIQSGKAIYNASHSDIQYEDLKEFTH
jgi:bacillithiol system protein YtxJ